jgi:uncharacterized repeat protein (TIGR03803 family)
MRAATLPHLVASIVLAAGTAASAQSYRVPTSFGTGPYDGALPYATVVRGADGTWFGTTANGGTVYKRGYCSLGCGTIFEMTPSGTRTTLHDFTGPDGEVPVAPLLLGADGWMYGTATSGGYEGGGTLYRLRPDGSRFAVLHRFEPRRPLRGADPQGPLLEGSDGRLYGVTVGGIGPPKFGQTRAPQWAIAYRIDPDGARFTVLHGFLLNESGGVPTDGLIEGSDGRLYGTSGISLGDVLETVFSMRMNGTDFRVLHVFHGDAPYYESPGLVEAEPGVLFGVTVGGGRTHGTVFALSLDGSAFRTLHRFRPCDGTRPLARLTVGPHHALYGTTSQGGQHGLGTLFSLRSDGSRFAVLHDFRGSPRDGAHPVSGVTRSSDARELFGTTQQGGANACFPFSGCGTVFTWKSGDVDQP